MFTSNFKRVGPCKGCKEGCPFAQIEFNFKTTGNYKEVERAMMFAVSAIHGKMPENYTKAEIEHCNFEEEESDDN